MAPHYSIIEKFEEVSDARSERVTLSLSRIPLTLRILLYLVSVSVIVGFFLLGIDNNLIAGVITAMTTTIVLLVIEVINDLDDPFTGKWAMSPDSFKQFIEST